MFRKRSKLAPRLASARHVSSKAAHSPALGTIITTRPTLPHLLPHLTAPRQPRFWLPLNPLLDNNPISTRAQRERDRLRLLVLEAKKIPFVYRSESEAILVPPLLQILAAEEIAAFERERDFIEPVPKGRDNWLGVILLLCPLLFWDALRHSVLGWHLYFLPADAQMWAQLGALKADAFAAGEWWRVFTALFLHGDAAHVLGNCLFGALFLLPLCRRIGLGAGFFLAIWGGALGNVFNTFFQGPGVASLGFSSAVFAALGALCAVTALGALCAVTAQDALCAVATRDKIFVRKFAARPFFICLAAGVAFLAFLGGSGEPGIDFSAHVLGFFGGLVLGLLLLGLPLCRLALPIIAPAGQQHAVLKITSRRDFKQQLVLLLLAFGLPVLSWYLAFTT